jgi:hypothetical protein
MKLQDALILYSRTVTSDGAGGKIPGVLVKVCDLWGNVKPLTGMIAMSFQQLTGTQGFEIITRTDFDFEPDREYILGYEGIYGEKIMIIHSVQIDKYYTKFICKGENKTGVQYS